MIFLEKGACLKIDFSFLMAGPREAVQTKPPGLERKPAGSRAAAPGPGAARSDCSTPAVFPSSLSPQFRLRTA